MSSPIITAYGGEHHLSGIDMGGNTFDIRAIAHSLSQINRFTGHAARPYSVAEHSLLCADIAERMNQAPAVQYAALMHDAHEAFVGDVSSPAKHAIGAGWDAFEDRHARPLRKNFGLATTFASSHHMLKQIDLVALATERRDLLPWRVEIHGGWPVLDTPGKPVPAADWVDLSGARRTNTHWTEWRDQFLERFHQVRAANAEHARQFMEERQS